MPRRVHLPGPGLPEAVQSVAFYVRPMEFVEGARRRYGANVRLKLAPFGETAYLSDPEAFKQVFTGGVQTYHAGEGNSVMEPILGPRSVLILDEDEHLEQRRRLLPPFHGEAIERYSATVRAIAEGEVGRWPVREPFAARPRMQHIALETILQAVLGLRAGPVLDRLRTLLPRLLDIGALDLMLLSLWPRLVETRAGSIAGPLKVRRKVDALLHEEIALRRARRHGGDDVLSMLIAAGADDGEIRDQVMTLLLAGHETTATGLAWTFERLTRHPEALARAADLDGDYLDAVCKEALRVRPVIMDVVRKVTRDVEIGGGRIEAGAFVMPSIALAHLDPATYDEPHEFRPERFLGVKPGTYTWLPFGGGPRRCLGAAFALMEMRLVLETVLRRVRLATTRAPGERPRFKHVTLVPARGARIAVAERVAVSERVPLATMREEVGAAG
jgi:cytochrome P450